MSRPSKPGRRAKTAIGAYDNYAGKKRRLREEGDALIAAAFASASPPAINHAHWPITVTDGPHPTIPGALNCRTFASRAEADAAGFGWIGRLASGA